MPRLQYAPPDSDLIIEEAGSETDAAIRTLFRLINQTFQTVITFSGVSAGTFDIGTVSMWMTGTPPTGSLLLNGANVSRATYAALFALWGTTFGVGDGATTFGLPDLRRRIPLGSGGTGTAIIGNAIGNVGGTETHALITAELAVHTHVQNAHNHTQDSHGHGITGDPHNHTTGIQNSANLMAGADWTAPGLGSTNTGNNSGISINGTTATNQAATATNQNTGSGTAHNNMPPCFVLNFIVKAL